MKKAFLTSLCLIVILVSSVNATFAFLTDRDSSLDSFSVGQVSIEFKDMDTSGSNKLLPGGEYAMKPVVTVLAGSEDCWLFMELENGIESIEVPEKSIAAQMAQNGWKELDGEDGIWFFGAAVPAGTALTVFDGFSVSPYATDAEIKNCNNAQLVVSAYAVQSLGFDTPEEAWAAFQIQNAASPLA